MYEDFEEPTSFDQAFDGALTIAYLIALFLLVFFFIAKLKQRKLHVTIIDFIKLIWLIISVIIIIWLSSLFFPEFTIDAANDKFIEFMPIKTGFLGAVTSILIAILINVFCFAGIAFYFYEPNKKNNEPVE